MECCRPGRPIRWRGRLVIPQDTDMATSLLRSGPKRSPLPGLLRSFPLSLQVVRGVDVCTDELGDSQLGAGATPRDRPSCRCRRPRPLRTRRGLEVPTLRTTVHVGEDYVHLLSGLRRVDEALGQFSMREGDRIGHGLALGVDPREWVQRAGRLAVACEDRLLDLAWEWSWYGREGVDPAAGRRPVC